MDGRAQAGDLPTVVGFAAFAIRFGQEEVPAGIEGVDFELEIVAPVAGGVEEDFEIVIVEDDRIVLGEGGPDVGFLDFGGDVEIMVVP